MEAARQFVQLSHAALGVVSWPASCSATNGAGTPYVHSVITGLTTQAALLSVSHSSFFSVRVLRHFHSSKLAAS
jgi:hypothetical protein